MHELNTIKENNMKKYFSLAAGATLLLGTAMGMVVPAFAQNAAAPAAGGTFADVPTDHWAYTAVQTLQKAGIVIGYPDGTYGGRRAMTRYEFAVAIARMLPMVQQQFDTSQFVKTSDFTAFQTDVDGKLAQQQQEIDALKALTGAFSDDLQKLGQNITAINARLDTDEQRLAVVEAEQRRVKITTDLNFIAESGINTDKNHAGPLDLNDQRLGSPTNQSLFYNPQVFNDVLVTIDGRVSDTAHAIVKIDANNYFPSSGSSSAGIEALSDPTAKLNETFGIYEAYLDMPVDLGPLSSAEAVVGRFGQQFTPYTLKAINPDVYTSLPETNGDFQIDGAKLNFGAGPAHVTVMAGKTNNDSNAIPVELTAGPNNVFRLRGQDTAVDETAGARVTFGNPDNYVIGVTGLVARNSDAFVYPDGNIDPYTNTLYNNVSVYGADFNGKIPFVGVSGLTLSGEFANSATGSGSRLGNVNGTHGTEAWNAELGYDFGPLNVKGGYKEIYGNFAAPGYWGQIGDYINPTNIKGPVVSASYAVTPGLSVNADGNFFQGIYNVGDQNPLGKDDDLTSYDVGLKYGLTSQYNVDLGYQWVEFNLKNKEDLYANAGKPTEQFITIGVGHSFNQNASLKLLYQIIDYSDKKTGFQDPSGQDEHGGIAVTQLSVKF
jgi:hypothetical protein